MNMTQLSAEEINIIDMFRSDTRKRTIKKILSAVEPERNNYTDELLERSAMRLGMMTDEEFNSFDFCPVFDDEDVII
jgi:hypothetical protein